MRDQVLIYAESGVIVYGFGEPTRTMADFDPNGSFSGPNTRFAVNLPSKAHSYLLNNWATLTGRSTASLVNFLLEKAIVQSLSDGEVPEQAVKAMTDYIGSIGENIAEDHQQAMRISSHSGGAIEQA